MRRLVILWAAVGFALVATGAAFAFAGPVAEPDYATLDEDTVAVVYPLLNDSDPAGGGLELIAVSSSPAGTIRIDGTAVVFTPALDFNGDAPFVYTVRSASGESSGQILFTVSPVNDPPIATDDAANASSGREVALDVLANDSDVDGDPLTISAVTGSENATVVVANGRITYTAAPAFSGVDVISYNVSDTAGATAEATVTIAVTFPPPTTSTTSPATTVPPTTVPPTIVPPLTAPPSTTSAPTMPPATTETPTTNPALVTPPVTTGAPTYVAAPAWAAPSAGLSPRAGTGNSDGLWAGVGEAFRSLYLPMLTLLVVGVVAWFLTQRGRDTTVRYAVVLIGLGDTLPVRARPGHSGEVVHHFEGSARQIEALGRPRSGEGSTWLPVASLGGQGWVEMRYLTEDVARVSFERDVVDSDLVRELRRRLKEGSTIATSPRGPIDPESFERDSGRVRLGVHATSKLAALIGDWRASYHIDGSASLAALRPPQLRNFHWISFEAPSQDPWQLFLEYHEGRPYPVAALPERAPAEAGST